MSARRYQHHPHHEPRTPLWVRAVTSDPTIRRVYDDNAAGAMRNFLAGRITETELDMLQWNLKQRAIRRYHHNKTVARKIIVLPVQPREAA